MKRLNINTIIFDFDGTLVDTRQAIVESFWAAIAECNISCSRRPSDTELTTRPLLNMLQVVGVSDEDLMSDAFDSYDRCFRQIVSDGDVVYMFPGVIETLTALQRAGFRMAIATHEVREILDHLLAALKLAPLFCASVCADEVVTPKPATDMIDHLLTELGGRPQDTLVVGDSIFDLKMGKAAGSMTCAVSYGVHSAAELRRCRPDWLIDDFSQLLDIEPVNAERGHSSGRTEN